MEKKRACSELLRVLCCVVVCRCVVCLELNIFSGKANDSWNRELVDLDLLSNYK